MTNFNPFPNSWTPSTDPIQRSIDDKRIDALAGVLGLIQAQSANQSNVNRGSGRSS